MMKRKMYFSIYPILLGFAGMLACSAPQQDVAAPAIEGPAIAKVNGSAIPESEFQKMGKRYARFDKYDLKTDKGKQQLLDQMIDDELLFLEALKQKLHFDPSVKRKLVRLFTNQISKKSYKPTDEEIRKYYQDHREEFEQISASHILIKPEKPGSPESEAKAKTKAQDILKRIKAGDDFAELAREFSQDKQSARRGGDLRFFGRGKMVPQFSDAAFELENIGDVSDIVKSSFGYHIIKLTGVKRNFEDFQGKIRGKLISEKRKEIHEDFVKTLRKNAQIDINEDLLKKAEFTAQKEKQLPEPGKKKLGDMLGANSPSDLKEKLERLRKMEMEKQQAGEK